MGWNLFPDRRSEASRESSRQRRIASMRSVDVDPKRGTRDKPRVTRSISAELRQKPDKATERLMKAADRGDPAAAAELAARWKRNN